MKKSTKTLMHCGIALVLGLIFGLGLQNAGNGLTVIGAHTLGVIIATIYLWLTVGTEWPTLLFMGMLIMTTAMTDTDVWAGSLGHYSVISIIVFMILNYCLMQTGVIDKICSWFITRKIVRNRPIVFIFMFLASMMIIGLFMENLSLAIIYVGIAEVLCAKIGIKKGDQMYTCMFLGVIWVDCVISIASPIAHAPCLILMGMMESQMGITISYGQWLAIGIPFAIIMLFVIALAIAIWRPDTTAYVNYDIEVEKKEMAQKPLTLRGKLTAIIFLACIVMILLPTLVENVLPNFSSYWTTVDVVVPAIIAVALLCIIHIDGEPLCDIKAAYKSIPLSAAIFAGVVSLMSTPINSEATGISTWLGNILQPVFSGLPPFLILIILALLALVMTNFVSNIVTMVLFFNIGLALLSGGTINMGMFAMLIGICSAMAVCTPSACAPMPLIFGPGHVTMKNSIKLNLIFIVFTFIVILAYCIPVVPLILG